MKIQGYTSPKGELTEKDRLKSLRDSGIVLIAAILPYALEQASLVEWGYWQPFATALIAGITALVNRKWNLGRI